MTRDKQTLFAEANVSEKRNLISVGGCVDTLLWMSMQEVMPMEIAHVLTTDRHKLSL
jgi:hypothetical protein